MQEVAPKLRISGHLGRNIAVLVAVCSSNYKHATLEIRKAGGVGAFFDLRPGDFLNHKPNFSKFFTKNNNLSTY